MKARVLSPSNLDVRRGTRCSLSGSCPHIAQRSRGTRCSRSGSCRRAAPLSGAFRRCSPADSPVGALAHRGAPLGTTHSNCNGSKRRRSPDDSGVPPSAPPGSRSVPPARANTKDPTKRGRRGGTGSGRGTDNKGRATGGCTGSQAKSSACGSSSSDRCTRLRRGGASWLL